MDKKEYKRIDIMSGSSFQEREEGKLLCESKVIIIYTKSNDNNFFTRLRNKRFDIIIKGLTK